MEEIRAISSEIYSNSSEHSDFCKSVVDILSISQAAKGVSQFSITTFDYLGNQVRFGYKETCGAYISLITDNNLLDFKAESVSIKDGKKESSVSAKSFYHRTIPFECDFIAKTVNRENVFNALKLVKRGLEGYFKIKFFELKHTLIETIDDIVDHDADGLSCCEKKVLAQTSFVCNSIDLFLTDVYKPDGIRVLFSSSELELLYRENEFVKKFVHKISQVSKKERKEFFEDSDKNGEFFENSGYRWIYVRPLITSNNDYAGTFIAASKKEYSEQIAELISAAGRILDTGIVSAKRTSLIAKRLKKHVGSANLHKLMENPSLLDPVKMDVVLLSADIAESTKFSSFQKEPYYVFSLINTYLCMIAEIVMNDYGGTLDKYIGDEVMAIFGAPLVQHDYIERAVNCALQIKDTVEQFNKKSVDQGREILEVKITLGFAKQVIAGEVGSNSTQTDYTVIGDGVNRFFRMARFAEPGKIIIDKGLKEALAGAYKTVFYKEVSFRGIEAPQRIYFLEKNGRRV